MDWLIQDYYNEYLDLKVELLERIKNLKYIERVGNVTTEGIQLKKDKINEKVQRLTFILNEMDLRGVDMKDLILLSVGVEIDLSKNKKGVFYNEH